MSKTRPVSRTEIHLPIAQLPAGAGHGPLGHALGTVPWNLIHKIVE